MKNQNILCCINDNPIFSYNPIAVEGNETMQQIILNYVTNNYVGKRWIHKEKTLVDSVEFFYYEINLEFAFQKIKKKARYQKNSLEHFCLFFLSYFLDENSDHLNDFFETVSNEGLQEIEDVFLKTKK